jgi:hypothetical protein
LFYKKTADDYEEGSYFTAPPIPSSSNMLYTVLQLPAEYEATSNCCSQMGN